MPDHYSAKSFTHLQKMLHWAVVVLLILQYLFFDGMGRPFHNLEETGTATYSFTVIAHIVIGVTVLVLALWRIALRLRLGAPPPPAQEPGWAQTAGKITHVLLYVMLVGLPLGGLAAWFTVSESLADLHAAGTNILLALVALHVGAVLVHQFHWKTNLLRRMI